MCVSLLKYINATKNCMTLNQKSLVRLNILLHSEPEFHTETEKDGWYRVIL